jgi:tetratricopeptide (TPR) repeat protein
MSRDNIYEDIYFRYYNLGNHAYYDKTRFYEAYIQRNSSLNREEKFDLTLDYIKALFAIGKYEKYLEMADAVIEAVIEENIITIHDEDVFQDLLFKKAASLYNLKKYEDSIYILNQLVRINKKDRDYRLMLWLAIIKLRIRKLLF